MMSAVDKLRAVNFSIGWGESVVTLLQTLLITF